MCIRDRLSIICDLSVFTGAAVAHFWCGQLPNADLIARIGFGSVGVGAGILAGIPVIVYRPAKWMIEEMW